MKWNSKTGLAALLIGAGVLILFAKLGIPLLSSAMKLIIPAAMVFLGWYGIRHGRQTIGWIVLIIGLIALMSALSGLIMFLLPIAMILIGWMLLKKRHRSF